MFKAHNLEIVGYRDERVPHTFFRQEDEAYHLAILLPGLGYTAYMPLLYYPMRLFLGLGIDVLRVEYAYSQRADYGALPASDQARWLFADASAACHSALAKRSYEEITLIGKSLGTLAMGYLLTTAAALARAQAIWLTPLLWNDLLRTQIQQTKPRSLFVTGTADPHYQPDYLAELQEATQGDAVIIDGANHSLEIKDDVFQSLQAIERMVHAILAFLGSDGPKHPTV